MNQSAQKREQARKTCFRRWEIENRLSSQRLELAQSAYVDRYGPRGLGANEIDLSIERANRKAYGPFGPSLTVGRSLRSVGVTNPSRFLTWYGSRAIKRQTVRAIDGRRETVDYAAALIDGDYVMGHRLADVDKVGKDRWLLTPRDAVPTWDYRNEIPRPTRKVHTFKHSAAVVVSRLTKPELDAMANYSPSVRGYGPALVGYVNTVNVPESVYLRAAEDPQGYSPALVALLKGARDVFAEYGETHPACDEFNRRTMRYRVRPDRVAFKGERRYEPPSPVRYQVTTEPTTGADGQAEYRTTLVGTGRGWVGHRRAIFARKATVVKVASGDEQQAKTGTRKGKRVESAFTMSERSLARAIKRDGVADLASLLEDCVRATEEYGGTVTLPNGVTITRLGVATVIHESGRAYPIREWSRRAAIAWTPIAS